MEFILKDFSDLSINLESNIELIVLESDVSDIMLQLNIASKHKDLYALENLLSDDLCDDCAMEGIKEKINSAFEKMKRILEKIKELSFKVFTSATNALRNFMVTINAAFVKGIVPKELYIPTTLANSFDKVKPLKDTIDEYLDYFYETLENIEKAHAKNEGYDDGGKYEKMRNELMKTLEVFDAADSEHETKMPKEMIKTHVSTTADFIKAMSSKIKDYTTRANKVIEKYKNANTDDEIENSFVSMIHGAIAEFKYIVNHALRVVQKLIVKLRKIAILAIPKKFSDKIEDKKQYKSFVKERQEETKGFQLPKKATAK